MINFFLGVGTTLVLSLIATCVIVYYNMKTKPKPRDKDLNFELLCTISRYCPHSFGTVKNVFDKVKSYDVTLIALTEAGSTHKDPVEIAEDYRKKSDKDKEVLEALIFRQVKTISSCIH